MWFPKPIRRKVYAIDILFIQELLENKKAHRIKSINISNSSSIADYFIIASAGNQAQLKALADECMEKIDFAPLRIEGYPKTEWILLDYGDIVIHLFLESAREFYSLEELWS